MAAKPAQLKPEAALELFRFAVEHLQRALWPSLDARRAAVRAAAIQKAVLEAFIAEVAK